MRRLAGRLRRLRWMAVPVAAYLAITLVLPALHGAAARPGFAVHAAWVLAGCAAVVGFTAVAGAGCALVCAGARRTARWLRRRAGANNHVPSDVVIPGGRA